MKRNKTKTKHLRQKNHIRFAFIFKKILTSGMQNSNVDMVLFVSFFQADEGHTTHYVQKSTVQGNI